MMRYERDFFEMASELTPAKSGGAVLDMFDVDEFGAALWFAKCIADNNPEGIVHVGRYARLVVDGELMMTDTSMEHSTNYEFLQIAHGDVLIAGLGIGMVLLPLVLDDSGSIRSITVVEKSQDVIDLIVPQLSDYPGWEIVEVVCADIYEWRPEKDARFNTIYFDIWPTLSVKNLAVMEDLFLAFDQYLDRTDPHCWLDAWSRCFLEDRVNEEREFMEAIKQAREMFGLDVESSEV